MLWIRTIRKGKEEKKGRGEGTEDQIDVKLETSFKTHLKVKKKEMRT